MVKPTVTDDEIKKLQDKVAALDEAQKRALADYQNLERRTKADRVRWQTQACEELLGDLLPTLDHLNRAVDHQPDTVLGMILAELQRVLANHGLERIWARNKPFDPQTMEAIGTAEGEKDLVVREEQAGYTLNGVILRPARVLVGTQENVKEKKE